MSSSLAWPSPHRGRFVGIRNFLYAQLQRHSVGFGLALGLLATVAGLTGGLGPELLLVGGVLAWLAWEARPNLYFALGCYQAAARSAHELAAGAGPSLRGDVHRLTEAAAHLTLGEVDAAKAALGEVDPERLPPRGRFVHFLNLSALYCRLGDGDSALAMVDASRAEAEAVQASWQGLPEVNRAAALCELGRFDEAAACLEEVGEARLPQAAHSYYFNNLAWALALGGGAAREALPLARKAVALRCQDPGCLGTLGVVMVLAGCDATMALLKLRPSLDELARRSPHGRGVVLAAAAHAYRAIGEEGQARALEEQLGELPAGERAAGYFRRALGATAALPAP